MSSTPESWQKFLKILSVFFIVFDLILIVIGVLVATGTFSYDFVMDMLDVPANTFSGQEQTFAMLTLGVAVVIAYLISLVLALFAYRGAKNPAKVKPAMVLFAIDSVFTLVSIVLSLFNGTFSWLMVSNGIIIWTMFYGTIQVNSLAKK